MKSITQIRFYTLMLGLMLMGSGALADSATLCKSFYLNPVSIEFGVLFQEAKDLPTLEALNEQSKNLIFALSEPDPLDHLINTLLYYRGLARILSPQELELQFGQKDYRFLYNAIKIEAHHKNLKFNFFRRYLLQGTRPVRQSELAHH